MVGPVLGQVTPSHPVRAPVDFNTIQPDIILVVVVVVVGNTRSSTD